MVYSFVLIHSYVSRVGVLLYTSMLVKMLNKRRHTPGSNVGLTTARGWRRVEAAGVLLTLPNTTVVVQLPLSLTISYMWCTYSKTKVAAKRSGVQREAMDAF